MGGILIARLNRCKALDDGPNRREMADGQMG